MAFRVHYTWGRGRLEADSESPTKQSTSQKQGSEVAWGIWGWVAQACWGATADVCGCDSMSSLVSIEEICLHTPINAFSFPEEHKTVLAPAAISVMSPHGRDNHRNKVRLQTPWLRTSMRWVSIGQLWGVTGMGRVAIGKCSLLS